MAKVIGRKFTVKQIKERIQRMKADRSTWETHWQEVEDYIVPRKNTITNQKSPGQKRSVFLVDSTGVMSNELLAGALHSLLTNPNAEWFEFTTGDIELDRQDDVRLFLQKSAKQTHHVLNNSNFPTEVHELYIDLGSIGTSPMFIEEDDTDVIRCSTKFIAEIYIDENRLGTVDTVFRCWQWEASKIVGEFGIDSVGKKVRESFEKDDGKKFELIHAVYPRTMVDPNHRSAFSYISQYVLPDEDIELREAGFREFPYVVPRWSKAAGEKYGRGPGMVALPEVKMLNKMTETMLIGAQKVVDPPLQLPDDGFIMPIETVPGGLNYYRSGTNDVIRPVFNDSRIDFGFQAMEDRRKRVRECFYVDQLQLQQGPQMTATEVMQRTEEKMRLLGPMLGRMQAEFLRPLLDRVFNIMMRRGMITDIPSSLRGKKIDVRYSSLIAKSQRLQEGQNILRTMQAVTPFYNIDQSIADNFNGDKATRAIAEVYGFPQDIFRTQKEIKAIRDGRAQAQSAAVQQQQQEHESEMLGKNVDAMAKMAGTGQ